MTPLRVLVCEDSRVYAAALRRVLEYDGDIAVDAVCATAEEAVAALPRIEPGLVTMDLELPGMDGLEAVGEIMSFRPLPILVLSAHVGPRSDKAAAALAAGAIDALAKDDLDLRDPAGAAGAAFRQRVRVLSRARVIRHPRARLGARPARLACRASPAAPRVGHRRVRVGRRSPDAGAPARRAAGRLPDPAAHRAAHGCRVHRGAGPLARPDRGHAGGRCRAGGAGRPRCLARAGGRTPHARCHRPAGP